MAIGIITPKRQEVLKPAKENTNEGAKWGALLGMVGGAAVGAATPVPEGTVGFDKAVSKTGSGLSGAGGGSNLGGLIGGMLGGDNSSKAQSEFTNVPTAIPQQNAMGRQLALADQDPHQIMTDGLAALGRYNDPQLNQTAGPIIFQGYQKSYNQRMG